MDDNQLVGIPDSEFTPDEGHAEIASVAQQPAPMMPIPTPTVAPIAPIPVGPASDTSFVQDMLAKAGQNLDNLDSMTSLAAHGDPEARKKLAEHSLGIAMGSLHTVKGPKERILPEIKSSNPIQRMEAAVTQLNKEGLSQSELTAATQRHSTELAKQRPVFFRPKRLPKDIPDDHYAEGGMVGIPNDQFTPDPVQPQSLMSAHHAENRSLSSASPGIGIPDSEFKSDEDTYGTPTEMAKTALEGAARGVIGPLAPMAEEAFGIDPEAIRARADVNPITAGAGEIAGLAGSMLTGVGEGAIAAKLGAQGAKALGFAAEGGGLAARLGSAAAKGAIENMTIGASDDVSRMVMQDPNASVGHAVSNLGLNAVLGGTIGGAFGGVGELWNAKFGGKLGQEIENFKGRMDEHLNNPDPVNAVTEELNTHYSNVKDMADEVYGPKGLKAEAIAKAMPEMGEPIVRQSSEVLDALDNGLQKLSKDDHLPLLAEEVDKYKSALQSNDPANIFDATQNLKKQLQEWGKYNANMTPLKEKLFRNTAKDLAFGIRESLEDASVWGDAAKIQKDINHAFSKFVNPLKQFESKFTSKITDMETGKITNIIDPAKIQTYINQLGKPNAELKKEMLANFLEAADQYKAAIDKTHMTIGAESPIPPSSLARTLSTLGEETTGSKIADLLIKKGLSQPGGQALGAGVGGALGHAAGIPGFGAIIGAHALGPFFSSVLPAIAKPLLGSIASGQGVKAATEYSISVAKGMKLASNATKNLFKAGSEVLPQYALPNVAQREKLDKTLKKIQENPDAMYSKLNGPGAYLPDHGSAMSQIAMSAVEYLNNLRTPTGKMNPFDSKPVTNPIQKAAFDRALDIAQQPLVVVSHIKNGTLIPSDIVTLKTLYPNLYADLQGKITQQMMDHSSKKDGEIPYKTRLSLSTFLGQPMDSTMTQAGIAGAQPLPSNAPQQQNPDALGKPKRGTASLSKMPGIYQTPGQNAAKDKSTRH